MRVEWIHCLRGRRGVISAFPAEMLAEKGAPGVTFRLSENGVKIYPDFRARNVSVNGKTVLSSALLEPDVPAFLRMGKNLLVVCATNKPDSLWVKYYRFPLWTIFEADSFDAVATVRSPQEIPEIVKRERLSQNECLVAPYGLTATIPFACISDIF